MATVIIWMNLQNDVEEQAEVEGGVKCVTSLESLYLFLFIYLF